MKILRKYFRIFKYLKAVRLQEEEIVMDDFEDKCFYYEKWNYLM